MSFITLMKSLNLCDPELSATLGYDAIVKYVDLVRCLKSTIALQEPSYHLDPPEALSASVHEFVKVCLDISDETAKLAWITLRKHDALCIGLFWLSLLRQAAIRAFDRTRKPLQSALLAEEPL
jgi:hypothetical protein